MPPSRIFVFIETNEVFSMWFFDRKKKKEFGAFFFKFAYFKFACDRYVLLTMDGRKTDKFRVIEVREFGSGVSFS